MTGDTPFAERPPEASFDFWQPPRMASQIQRRRTARWTCAAPCAVLCAAPLARTTQK